MSSAARKGRGASQNQAVSLERVVGAFVVILLAVAILWLALGRPLPGRLGQATEGVSVAEALPIYEPTGGSSPASQLGPKKDEVPVPTGPMYLSSEVVYVMRQDFTCAYVRRAGVQSFLDPDGQRIGKMYDAGVFAKPKEQEGLLVRVVAHDDVGYYNLYFRAEALTERYKDTANYRNHKGRPGTYKLASQIESICTPINEGVHDLGG